ncbi:MAG: bifunctional serine/threonine-protein kinase/formylglycine-generating enzyme family protein [Nostocaceae cyanobacterium]|nr:bifunctional serine/threonine-protein kinase/formylglycine-generating enzyme family protein [Nostocaceae cyanobacterium]
MVWASGQQLQGGKYVIEQVLGQGGFGITYKARHSILNNFVVIKTPNESLKNDPEYGNYIKRFINEGQRLEKLSQTQHPNIVRVRDLFHEGGTYCLVMDFVQGESLFNLVQRRGALPTEEALQYITQIGDALTVVHQGGLVHRDAHPGNMMIQQYGKAILIDFGIAGEIMPVTVSSKFFGNPGFAPHEQMRGDRKPYVDVYSLAASLYYAITGKRPTESFQRKAYNMPLVPPQEHVSTISNELNQAILKGMELEPENRPQTMQSWLAMLLEESVTIWTRGHQLQNGKYTIEIDIARGGFGITYLATDEHNQRVVIKTLNETVQKRPDFAKFQQDFLNEAIKLAKCNHPHIVKVHEVFPEGKLWCMVMEYIQGEDLADRVVNRGVLSEAEAVGYIQQIGEALTVVHNNGLLHRDVKPANILIRAGKREAVLIDFGIAREFTPSETRLHTPYLSRCFAPIEQYQTVAKRGAYTDVYALAATLYFLVTKHLPHPAINRVSGMVLESPRSINPSISNRVNDAILKGMELEPANRPQTMQSWLELLKEPPATTSTLIPIYKPPTPQPPTPQPSISQPLTPKLTNTIPSLPINQNQQVNNPQTPINPSRRKFIQTLGWMGAGLGATFVVGRIFTNASRQIVTPPSPVTKISTKSNLLLQSLNFETVRVDSKGKITNRRQLNATHFAEYLGGGVTLEMVEIPGGTFTMGLPAGKAHRDNNESPQHQVTVTGFFMGRYEVTQAQYQAIIGQNPSRFKGKKQPVENVSWNDAVEFCQKLSQKTGRTYRLPSEAEWEYACRAGTTTPFYFGETITTDLVNYDGNSTYASAPKGEYRQQTTDVGTFPPNAFGLYDMHGNVWEWCQDTWHQNYNDAPTDGSAWIDENENRYRLLRGGSWFNNPFRCLCAHRDFYVRAERDYFVNFCGFRVVCEFGRTF